MAKRIDDKTAETLKRLLADPEIQKLQQEADKMLADVKKRAALRAQGEG